MRRFAQLFDELDGTTSTLAKVELLVGYLQQADAADAAWAVYFLCGGRPARAVTTTRLRELACRVSGLTPWLFEACYERVGDLAETIALVVGQTSDAIRVVPGAAPGDAVSESPGLAQWVEQRILGLHALDAASQDRHIESSWKALDTRGRFLFIKLIAGGFRVGVSRLLVQRAVAQASGWEAGWIAQRMMGWTDKRFRPTASDYAQLVSPIDPALSQQELPGQPYPFFLAHTWESRPSTSHEDTLGEIGQWMVEWKYDGIRAQVVRRQGQCWIWTRGEELVTQRFPEVAQAAQGWPDGTVIDGELLAWAPASQRPLPFVQLQQRITRNKLSAKLLQQTPVCLVAYDLLEDGGVDCRQLPQEERRRRLEQQANRWGLRVADVLIADSWQTCGHWREQARDRGVEGLMLKHRRTPYGVGRRKTEHIAPGGWLKWKVDPHTVDAVLLYAQVGHGKRAGLYTDYTFALWNRPPADPQEAQAVAQAIEQRRPPAAGALQLVTLAKAYSGLTQEEIVQLDRIIRKTTVEKFGPVRSVKPQLVFELGFEAMQPSARHRSGWAVRFPRILRWRHDKLLHEADSVSALQTRVWALTEPSSTPAPTGDLSEGRMLSPQGETFERTGRAEPRPTRQR